MTNFIKSVVYISVCIIACVSCKEEAVELDYSPSYGSWVLDEALKDGVVTKTLKGTIFDIDSSKITTNLFGGDIAYDYSRDGNRIELIVNGSQVFNVDKSTTDSLVLSMKRKRKVFQLFMLKDTVTVK